jgi:hypothetical protein
VPKIIDPTVEIADQIIIVEEVLAVWSDDNIVFNFPVFLTRKKEDHGLGALFGCQRVAIALQIGVKPLLLTKLHILVYLLPGMICCGHD